MNTIPHFQAAAYIIAAFLACTFSSCQPTSSNVKKIQPLEIPKLLDRNESLRQGKEWDDVASQYQKLKLAVADKPSDHESVIKLAQLFIREARVTGEHGHYYNAALKMTDYVLGDPTIDNGKRFLAKMTKAGVQLSHHDFHGALKTGQEALTLNPNNPQIYGVLVDAHVELGQYDKAVLLADRMMAMKPDLRSYARVSYLREIHGQMDASIDAMRMAIEAGIPGYEDTAWAMLTLAEIYEKQGKNEQAKALYEEILAQRTDYPFAIAGLGKLALERGEFAEALTLTQKAIDIIPEVGFYIQQAEIFKSQGQCQKMDATIKEIFAMLADDEKSGHNMTLEYAGLYYDLLDDPITAELYAKKEYALRPDNIDVNKMMFKIHNKLNNPKLAAKFQKASKII
jgi:tetratricopeptide (TPR) repeat protein